MARKRHTSEQELPFVALMDTMTNVVGVLAIVLVMMGISLARAASRVLSSLPPATAAQIRTAQDELNRLRAAQVPEQNKLKALAPPRKTAAVGVGRARQRTGAAGGGDEGQGDPTAGC